MPKKSDVVRFPSLYNPMRDIRCNKETCSVDLLDNTHAGNNHWSPVFYGVKSKLLVYYILGSKNPTASLTLDTLGNFIADHGIPIMIITYSYGVLGAGKKWKHYLVEIFTPLRISKTDKHNQNPVK